MNLLLTRSQEKASFFSLVPLKIGGVVTFKLNAEFELDEEEHALTKKYGFTNATLIYTDFMVDLRNAFTPSWYLGLMVMILVALFYEPWGQGFDSVIKKVIAVPISGIATVLIMTTVYFFSLRKFVTVDQMLNGGRTFYCHSVVELDEHERELKDLAHKFHITLEKAKNWGGRELNPIPEGEILYLSDQEYNQRKSLIEKAMESAGRTVRNVLNSVPKNATEKSNMDERPANQRADPKPTTTRTSFQSVERKNEAPQSEAKPTVSTHTSANDPKSRADSPKPQSHPFAPKPPSEDG